MDKRTISGVKNPERIQRYIRKLKYKYFLLYSFDEDKEKIIEEFEENPYASETPKEVLIQCILSIVQSKSFKRLSNKTMAHQSSKVHSDKTVKRMIHSISAFGLMLEYCSELKLNKELGMAIALGHDVGHTPYGHEGESIFKKIALESNLGTYAHNLQGRLQLEQIEGLDITPDVLDGIQCHNGEKEEFEVPVNYDKTEEDALNDLTQCLAHLGKEREQIPGTFEGAAFRIIDKISYVGQDLADGFRERILNPRDLDTELKSILNEIGINDEKINQLLSQDKKYSLDTIKRIFEQLETYPIGSMVPGKTKTILESLIEDLKTLKDMDFSNGAEFNKLLSKIAGKFTKISSKAVNLTADDKLRFLINANDLNKLMNQDTSGGNLAREIEKIFMEDFIKNSKGKDHPCMSEKMGDLMYDLIGYTQETVLPATRLSPENHGLLIGTINNLVNYYTNILLASGVVDEIVSQLEENYEPEEKNTNKEKGIFDDIEMLKKDSKIEGHTRKLFAQNKEYFQIVINVIKESQENNTGSIELTFREKVAKRIAIDYASRNNEKKLLEKAYNKGLISKEDINKLNTPTVVEEILITPEMNLYETRVGMHTDRMNRKIDKLKKIKEFITCKKELKEMDLIERIDDCLTKLQVIQESYNGTEDFKEKKTFFKDFKKRYREISCDINYFRKQQHFNKEEEKELNVMLTNRSTIGAPELESSKKQAKKEAVKEMQENVRKILGEEVAETIGKAMAKDLEERD